ncbi:hypothetical protein PEP31012_02178 [Pandoraea eparura]|uniref:Uncharacterized protein n=1 Tax=Pandoraea eparura TaxID=2508291 RepID=A0A5E4UQQ1_9BURK|nr:hypothetical protein PEP31012_02178 [Pandoraea eparura]
MVGARGMGSASRVRQSGSYPATRMARRDLSTVFVHNVVDNEPRKVAKRLIGMRFST